MDQSGKLPAAVRVGHAKRWLRAAIIAWLAGGCPSRRKSATVGGPDPPALLDFARFWRLFGFALSKRARERIFAPDYEGLVAQLQWAHEEQYNTRWARRSLNLAFIARTVMMVTRCSRSAVWAITVAAAARFTAPLLRCLGLLFL